MKSVKSSVYTKEYYLNTCLGFEEFGKFQGRNPHKRIKELGSFINWKNLNVLDLGCGRGDFVFYSASKGASVLGVDYSKDAISLAKEALGKQLKYVQKNVGFIRADVKKINFRDDSFDVVIAIDLFEHLYKEELEVLMRKISQVLKKDGILLVHTEVNKIYLDFTHPLYVYPLSSLLIWFNKFLRGKSYPNLPKDPRNEFHKIQHVNEPTYFYLKNLFKRYKFEGRITSNISYKPYLSWKDRIYNIIVWAYPFSSFWPLNLLFASDYICVMRNKK